jgi:hypothetical protein
MGEGFNDYIRAARPTPLMKILSKSGAARGAMIAAVTSGVVALLATPPPQPAQAAEHVKQTAVSALTAAAAATENASSFVCQGTAVDGRIKITFDVSISQAAAVGSIAFDGQPAQVRRLFLLVYTKATQGFYSLEGLGHDAAELLSNHWIQSLPGASGYAQLSIFVYEKSLIGALLPEIGASGARSEGQKTVGGTRANVFQGSFGGVSATVYVAAHGKPYLIRIFEPSRKVGGTVNFLDYKKPVHVKAPQNVLTTPSPGNAAT